MAFAASAWIHVETGNREEVEEQHGCCCYQKHPQGLPLEQYGLVWSISEHDDDNHDGIAGH